MFHHIAPPAVFPSTFSHGCQRKFRLEKYSWLLYSPNLDGVFCGPCSILLPSSMNRADKGFLVNRPFSNWIKISNTLANHASLQYHRHTIAMADSLKSSVNNPAARVDTMFSGAVQKTIEENKQIIRQIM